MLAGEIFAPRQIRLVEVPEPTLDHAPPGQLLLEVELGCLCGSDSPFFTAQKPEFPCRIGQSLHELVGRVVATTGDRFQPGQRVLCVPVEHFGLWERFVVSQERAIEIDPRVTAEEAVLAQPLGTILFAMRKLPAILGWDVAVVGQGPIGQLFCSVLRNLGARHIFAIDRLAQRLELSPHMGATRVIDLSLEDPVAAITSVTGGTLPQLVVEAVGHDEQAIDVCIDLVRDDGHLLLFGVPSDRVEGVRWRRLFWKNIKLITSVGPDFALDFPLAMQWVAQRRIDVRPLVSHRFHLAQIQQAYETFVDRLDRAMKVFIEFPAASQGG
jgi:threonine dehydrogenase-like Zn-dependent dehydrogenase